jgi:hypothetical protein
MAEISHAGRCEWCVWARFYPYDRERVDCALHGAKKGLHETCGEYQQNDVETGSGDSEK